MSWWRKIFGGAGGGAPALPERASGPRELEPGELRDGVKHGVWIEPGESEWELAEVIYRDGKREGPYRAWNGETGQLLKRGTYVADAKEGVCETYNEGAVRFRIDMRAGKYHGMVREYRKDGTLEQEREWRADKLWAGPDDRVASDGTVLQRGRYEDGHRAGAWEENNHDGSPKLRAHYAGGVLDGAYREHYGHGAVRVVGTYERGARVGAWRWLEPDGTLATEAEFSAGGAWRAHGYTFAACDDEALARWVALAGAWAHLEPKANGGWFKVEHAVEAWPEAERATAIAWVAARIAETADRDDAPLRTSSPRGWFGLITGGIGDARAALVDGVVADHATWNAEAVAHVLRRACDLRTLSLTEVNVTPNVAALFPADVAWPRLVALTLIECGPLDEIVRRLAGATWSERLRALYLDDEDGIADADAAHLVSSMHLGALRTLHLTPIQGGRALADALAVSPVLAHVEELGFESVGEPVAVLAAIAARETPALRILELGADDFALDPAVLRDLASAARRPRLEQVLLDGCTAPADALAAIARERPDLEICVDDADDDG